LTDDADGFSLLNSLRHTLTFASLAARLLEACFARLNALQRRRAIVKITSLCDGDRRTSPAGLSMQMCSNQSSTERSHPTHHVLDIISARSLLGRRETLPGLARESANCRPPKKSVLRLKLSGLMTLHERQNVLRLIFFCRCVRKALRKTEKTSNRLR
jgi:hypothetical protein